MLEDLDKQFDLDVRSLMDGAQEEVPEGVWDAISSRLDEAEGVAAGPVGIGTGAAGSAAGAAVQKGRTVRIWLRNAGVGMAAAAAVAVAVVFGFRQGGSSDPVSGGQAVAQVQEDSVEVIQVVEAEDDALIAVVPQEEAPAAEKVLARATTSTAVGTMTEARTEVGTETEAGTESRTETQVGTETETTTDTESEAGTETPVGTETETMTEIGTTVVAGNETRTEVMTTTDTETEVAGEISDWDDVFAEDEEAVSRRRGHRVSLTISGNALGGNDSRDADMVPGGPMYSQGQGFTNYIWEEHTIAYGIPISAGVGVKINFTDRFAMGIGIKYSLLTRTLEGIYYNNEGKAFEVQDIRNSQHYLGIPVNFYYSIIQGKHVDFYAYAGGTVERCLADKYLINSDSGTFNHDGSITGVQFSANAGIGVEFLATKWLGIYIDPSIGYYFDSPQPNSIRKTQPLMFGFEAGLRFRL